MTDSPLFTQRRAGLLLHPTALPAPHGIGDLGPAAFHFVDLLHDLNLSLWQVLPLGPVSFGYSPYQAPSSFAGNPLLISLERLQAAGYWQAPDTLPDFPEESVDFPAVWAWKNAQLRQAFQRFEDVAQDAQRGAFQEFCAAEAWWLDDFALFMALKAKFGGSSWSAWPAPFAQRQDDALQQFRAEHAHTVREVQWQQWVFWEQWQALRAYAATKRVEFFGDVPIFVAQDSAEVWAHRRWFLLDDAGQPTHVAGVPPDYFSETGQRWGNPLYDWDALAEEDFSFWQQRLRHTLRLVQWVRVDHFRGFESFWKIPASAETAMTGEWVKGPDVPLFERLRAQLGELPIIAEDLGLITQAVHDLRDACGFPGMRVLQFAFYNDPWHPFLPHSQPHRSVVYTGTHDNNTTRGWWDELSTEQQQQVQEYLDREVREDSVAHELLRLAWSSPAVWALAPLQDALNLGVEARFNTPGTIEHNWRWRCTSAQLEQLPRERLRHWTTTYGRALT